MRAWIAANISAREVQFYGGLAMLGGAPGRWSLVGGLLALHVVIAPVLALLGPRRTDGTA